MSNAPPAEKEEAVDPWTKHKLPDGARTLLVGVHRVIYIPPAPLTFVLPGKRAFEEKAGALAKTIPAVRWLLGELYTLGPIAYPTILGLDLVLDLLPTASAFLNHRVLSQVRVHSSGTKLSDLMPTDRGRVQDEGDGLARDRCHVWTRAGMHACAVGSRQAVVSRLRLVMASLILTHGDQYPPEGPDGRTGIAALQLHVDARSVVLRAQTVSCPSYLLQLDWPVTTQM
jgi:hypothetical protein